MQKYSFDDLNGKVCVLTGGGGVIGAVLAKGLAEVGVKLAILDIKKEFADKVADEVIKGFGTEAIGVEANVLDKSSLESAKKIVIEKFGNVDILINGAGGNSPKATTKDEFITDENINSLENTFFGLELEGFQKVFDLNFLGTLLPTMVFAKEMVERKSGVILNVSSMNSFRPLTKIPAYSAAKSSINNFTEWLAVHFAKMNVRVNAIAPGFFLTNQNRFLLLDEKTNELTARGKKIIDNTPMNKFGETEDLVGGTLFLLSNLSSFITGTVMPIDGGFNIYSGV
ncbi:MAG: SDR family oxidoreductase [Ignavibacteriales bacterium]|nr:SDR family oxidoreductase [Ignavibacteriota bacterium]MCB0748604.1 SDR family oxidoreductase [Ignavibacteriota bacterium]MCB9247607.1 SDR family oxidoreductase [Ignavibacteriales bacterium]